MRSVRLGRGGVKDAKKLYKAIEAKLGEQRRFVLWWDGQEKDKGGDAQTHARRRSPTAVRTGDFGLDRDTIHRWHMTKGQRAMAIVMIRSEPQQGKRTNLSGNEQVTYMMK